MIERIEINLLPAEYRVHKKTIKLQREVFYPLLGLLVFACLFGLWTIGLQNQISQLQNENSALDMQIKQNKPIQQEINNLQRDKRTVQEKIRALERINVNRERWVRLMEVLSSRLPEYTWLASIKEDPAAGSIDIEGRTYSFPEVANYMTNLRETEYITNVDLSNIEQIDPKQRSFKFLLKCAVNPDANLGQIPKTTAAATTASQEKQTFSAALGHTR